MMDAQDNFLNSHDDFYGGHNCLAWACLFWSLLACIPPQASMAAPVMVGILMMEGLTPVFLLPNVLLVIYPVLVAYTVNRWFMPGKKYGTLSGTQLA